MRQTKKVLPELNQNNGTKSNSNGMVPSVDDDKGEDEDEDEDEAEPVKILEEIGSFDKVMVWGHEQVPAGDDVFVRGMEEWIGFAEAIHGVGDGRTPSEAKAGG